jgi:hypothetical protein
MRTVNDIFKRAFLVYSLLSVLPLPASQGMYQTPPVLYVGDRGTLIYPLDVFIDMPGGALVFPDGLPKTEDISVNKIELDRKNRRIVIEFQGWRTGVISLPPIDINGFELNGLQVTIASLVDSRQNTMALSPGASPLAAPGTFWVILAVSAGIIAALFIIVVLWISGGKFFTDLRRSVRTKVLLFGICSLLRRMERRLEKGRLGAAEALGLLSQELRVFLSRLWSRPCYAMSAEEFLYCGEETFSKTLYDFFKRCDDLRFGGRPITDESVKAIGMEAKTLVTSIAEN